MGAPPASESTGGGPQKKVIFCIPTISKPYPAMLASLEASIPMIRGAGWDEASVYEIGCCYVSVARAKILRKALDAKADVIVFLDHDLSWDPEDLLLLIEAPGDVICGTYRYKREPEQYMGAIFPGADGRPIVRDDGCVLMHSMPAGFLKLTRSAVQAFMRAYPELLYGDPDNYSVDLFNHGAIDGVWMGEDYAFAKRWREKCGHIWCLPHLNIVHHGPDGTPYPGNYHYWLARQKGGSLAGLDDDALHLRAIETAPSLQEAA